MKAKEKKMKVEFYKHNLSEEAINNLVAVTKTLFLTTGKVVEEFEQKLANYLGVKYCIGTSSCTAALHLSLLAAGIREYDKVITTPLTFVATANAILYTGATPIFVDVSPVDGCIDPNKIGKVASEACAVIPVHLYGQRCNMKQLYELELDIIEDAAHALELKDFHDFACFSFYPTKSITCGEGGAIACNSKVVAQKLKGLRLHGMTKTAWSRYEKKYEHWDMKELGYKCNMTNLQAALLMNQLDHIEEFRARRKQICEIYEDAFAKNDRIGLMHADEDSARLMFTILVEKRDEVLMKLQERGIGVAVNYRPVHLLEYYKKRFGYKEGDFPNAEYIGSRTITLPVYPKLTNLEQEYVIDCVKDIV